MRDYEKRILNLLCSAFLLDKDDIDTNTSLLSNGLIESTAILKVISILEDEFNISIPNEDLTIDNFETVNNIVSYLNKKIN